MRWQFLLPRRAGGGGFETAGLEDGGGQTGGGNGATQIRVRTDATPQLDPT